MNKFSIDFTVTGSASTEIPWEANVGTLIVAPAAKDLNRAIAMLPKPLAEEITAFATERSFSGKAGAILTFDSATKRKATLAIVCKGPMYKRLEWARRAVAVFGRNQSKPIIVDLRSINSSNLKPIVHALVSALSVAHYEVPNYKTKKEKPQKDPKSNLKVTIAVGKEHSDSIMDTIKKAQALADGTNIVRQLSCMAGNDLTTSRYVELAMQMAKNSGLKTDFLSIKRLEQMKAGAFLAVNQGSSDRGGGILKVMYNPPKQAPPKDLAIVGKGITFDTGGNNLKSGNHMFGMHQDMTGSAIALAIAIVAAKLKWPYKVTAYLAITDNILGPNSFRPNDVVKSLKGTTIEIVDTDAEGRLVLSDTLWLASSENPDLLIDFATLTGSCIRAIGTRYSGVYVNRKKLFPLVKKAGALSGERVWPFPNDPDYGNCLKSKVADIRQCRVTGGVDHIEASYFLRQFVKKEVPYVHIDLSACNNEGGLAHVPTETTGFGVLFASKLISLFFDSP